LHAATLKPKQAWVSFTCSRPLLPLPDVIVGSYIGWGIMQKAMDPLPALTAYLARVEQREAAKRANELDDALIKQD